MENGQYVPGSLFFYAPNKGAPVFFTFCFAVSGLCHIWQCIHYKSWKLTGLYVICAALFAGGYAVREAAAYHDSSLVLYIVTVCLVYAAPPVFEVANYNALGRILYFVPYHSPIHPGRVITTFAFISSVVEALNGNGASYSSNSSLPQSKQDVGRALLKAALLIQLVVVGLFLLLATTFHRRCRRAGIRNAKLYAALHTLYASTALIAARTIYRVVEYWSVADLHPGPGFDPQSLSPIVRYEWFFYVFEAVPMLCNSVLLNARHPRRYLPESTKVYLAKDGVTEVVGPGYKDTRPFLLTLFDPLDLVGLARGRDKETMFWEENNDGVAASDKNARPQRETNLDV